MAIQNIQLLTEQEQKIISAALMILIHEKKMKQVWKKSITPNSTSLFRLAQVIRGDGHYNVSQRFGLYRWHITDPIRFEKNLKVTIQALGWRAEGRYLPLQDDIASTVFWYQTEPHQCISVLPE